RDGVRKGRRQPERTEEVETTVTHVSCLHDLVTYLRFLEGSYGQALELERIQLGERRQQPALGRARCRELFFLSTNQSRVHDQTRVLTRGGIALPFRRRADFFGRNAVDTSSVDATKQPT